MTFQPPSTKIIKKEPKKESVTQQEELQSVKQREKFADRVDTVIIGSLALDSLSTMSEEAHLTDSNPGVTTSSIGGVGYNVSLAHKYGLISQGSSKTYRLVSAVGSDFTGRTVLEQLEDQNIDTSGILVAKDHHTCQYTSIHQPNGDLIVACADMKIVEQDILIEHLKTELARGQPSTIIIDCNLSSNIMNEVLEYVKNESNTINIIIEPTSVVKAKRLSQVNSRNLLVYPNNLIDLVNPTEAELLLIFTTFSQRELFDDYDDWFPVLDSLGITSQFRERLLQLLRKNPILTYLSQKGILQQSFQLLPYIPNILIKLGEKGAVLVNINKNIKDYDSIPTTSQYKPEFTICSQGRKYSEDGEDKQLGVVIQYFPIPVENQLITIKNVTGAGDSLLGFFTSGLQQGWLDGEIRSVEQEWDKWESIYKSQLASGLSLQSDAAISEAIQRL